jgi:molybdenum cofactor cytidylyltransferase
VVENQRRVETVESSNVKTLNVQTEAMQLTQAFGIRDKEVVALVGGGGKTTTMLRLADELVTQGKRVVVTTTTRIFAAQIRLAPYHLFARDAAQALREVQAALPMHPCVLVIGAASGDGKAFGIEPAWIDALIALDDVDAVLVEADGSRMRPFKAPAEHEPVLASATTLLVPVVGIAAVGKALNDEHVHRAELVAQLAGIPLHTVLEPAHIARVLGHAQGGLKNRPPHARVIPLINQVEEDAQRARALEIARHLLQNDAIDAVAIGAVKHAQSPVSSLESCVAAIILAAGGSTRMRGDTKQLLRWGEGTLVQNAVQIAARAGVSEIIVVTGNRADAVTNALEGMPARIVRNPDWASGRASSVRAGIQALSAKTAAAVFINADQPFLTPQVIDALLARYAATRAPIVAPTFEGQTGSPVLFARTLFDELASLRGDVGGKAMFETYRAQMETIPIADARAAIDVDTPEDYAHAREMGEGEGG